MANDISTGPLGFPMPSKVAFEAESALKTLPKEIRERFSQNVTDADGKEVTVEGYCRRTMATKDTGFNDDERSEVSTITTDEADKDREVVMPGGLDFNIFLKRPIVALSHNYKLPSIGKNVWIKRSNDGGKDGWKAKTVYTPRPEKLAKDAEWLPESTWFYVREGLLPGKSIGFIPMDGRAVTKSDIDARPSWKNADFIITKGIVLEYSVCLMGANPDSIVEAYGKMASKGVSTKSLCDAFGLLIPGSVQDEPESEEAKEVDEPVTVVPVVDQKAVQECRDREIRSIFEDLKTTIEASVRDRVEDGIARILGRP